MATYDVMLTNPAGTRETTRTVTAQDRGHAGVLARRGRYQDWKVLQVDHQGQDPRGGARPGSGRPPKWVDVQPVSLQLPRCVVAAIDQARALEFDQARRDVIMDALAAFSPELAQAVQEARADTQLAAS